MVWEDIFFLSIRYLASVLGCSSFYWGEDNWKLFIQKFFSKCNVFLWENIIFQICSDLALMLSMGLSLSNLLVAFQTTFSPCFLHISFWNELRSWELINGWVLPWKIYPKSVTKRHFCIVISSTITYPSVSTENTFTDIDLRIYKLQENQLRW